MIRLLRRLLQERRSAAALIIAMSSIPMIIAAGAAVDFSRIAAARAQLQFAADSASLAGAGAFQTNEDGTAAYDIAKTAFDSSVAGLLSYASVTGTVGTKCNPAGKPNVTCGSISPANGASALCPASTIYCVQVSARATLRNSLLAFVIPSDVLNVNSAAQSTGTSSVGTGNFYHTGINFGSDQHGIYVSAVPLDSAGNPEYGSMAAPNSNCGSASYGPLHYLPETQAASGVTTCNYVLIGETGATSGWGNFSFSASDPLSFTFVDFSGGTVTSGTTGLDTTSFNSSNGAVTNTGTATRYTNEIYVTSGGSTQYYATGKKIGSTALYGCCPEHDLYGNIVAYPNASAGSDIVPYQDSISVYYTGWEVLGWPPTHGTNHALLPFLGPANSQSISGKTYTVHAICPQWPITGTKISATASFSPSSLPSGYSPVTSISGNFPTAANVPVYSTYYPDAAYGDAAGTYPPVIAACTPATSSGDGGVTPTSDDPWWGWSPPNAAQADPGGSGENPGGGAVTNCTATRLNSTATGIIATQDALQSARYNDCAFLIQPLGTNVPSSNGVPDLPDYYTYTVSPGAFGAGNTGNAASIISSLAPPLSGMTPVFDGIGNSNPGGYVPNRVSISGTGPYIVTEPPLYGTGGYPPEDTSHQCYNPRANGIDGSLLPGPDQPNNDSPVTPIDPVANPQYGAVLCDSNPPPVFVLMWNDMGTWSEMYNDDLGYANALTEFACPTPGNPGTSGPATLLQ